MTVKKFILVSLFLAFTFVEADAQVLTAHRGTVESGYNYWFYEPPKVAASGAIRVKETDASDSTSIARKPLIIFLHGKSLCGTDLNKVRRYGTIDAISKGLQLDAYVLAPQNPSGGWKGDKIRKLIEWSEANYAIDTTRIYVLGMSLGGYGTITVTAYMPETIAASIALCGGGSKGVNLANLCKVPMCIIHGTKDKDVPVTASQKVVDAMVEAGDTTRLLWYKQPGLNHSDLARYFYLKDAYRWLFEHSLSDENRPVNRDYDFSPSCIDDVYRHINSRDGHMTVVDHRSGSSSSSEASVSSSEYTGVHVVKQGDTLSGIAKKYHTTVKRLCSLNGIKETSILRIGQKIKY